MRMLECPGWKCNDAVSAVSQAASALIRIPHRDEPVARLLGYVVKSGRIVAVDDRIGQHTNPANCNVDGVAGLHAANTMWCASHDDVARLSVMTVAQEFDKERH